MKYWNLVFVVVVLVLVQGTCNEAGGKVDRCRALWQDCEGTDDDLIIHYDAADMNSYIEGDVRQVKYWDCVQHVWRSTTVPKDCDAVYH